MGFRVFKWIPRSNLFGAFRFITTTQDYPWQIVKLNHVAIATKNLDKTKNLFGNTFHSTASDIQNLPDHGVRTVFVDVNNTKLELLDPLGDKSPITKYLSKVKDGGIHHLCFEVDNLENAIKDLRSNKIVLLSDEAKIGAHGKSVVFIHPNQCSGVLIELEQA